MTLALVLVQPVTAGVCLYLVLRFLRERDREDRRERQVLLQRIQAPEQAVVEHIQASSADEPAVNPFDDEDYWDAANKRLDQLAAELTPR